MRCGGQRRAWGGAVGWRAPILDCLAARPGPSCSCPCRTPRPTCEQREARRAARIARDEARCAQAASLRAGSLGARQASLGALYAPTPRRRPFGACPRPCRTRRQERVRGTCHMGKVSSRSSRSSSRQQRQQCSGSEASRKVRAADGGPRVLLERGERHAAQVAQACNRQPSRARCIVDAICKGMVRVR